jgi:hypothetical protein
MAMIDPPNGRQEYNQIHFHPLIESMSAPNPIAGFNTAPDEVMLSAAHRDLAPTYDAAMMKHYIAFSLENTVFSSV